MTPPRCPEHGLEYQCPACTGAAGGAARTPRKAAASRLTLAQARAVRAKTLAMRCGKAYWLIRLTNQPQGPAPLRYCSRPAGHDGPCRGGLTVRRRRQ